MLKAKKPNELVLLIAKSIRNFSISNIVMTANNRALGSLFYSFQSNFLRIVCNLCSKFFVEGIPLNLTMSIVSCLSPRHFQYFRALNVRLKLRNFKGVFNITMW